MIDIHFIIYCSTRFFDVTSNFPLTRPILRFRSEPQINDVGEIDK